MTTETRAIKRQMTTIETRAIKRLQSAIKAAHKIGIRLAGMDGALLYATASAYKKGQEVAAKAERESGSCYSAVAHACNACDDDRAGTLDDKCYEDSGCW